MKTVDGGEKEDIMMIRKDKEREAIKTTLPINEKSIKYVNKESF